MTAGRMDSLERAANRLREIRREHFKSYADEAPPELEEELAELRNEIRNIAEQLIFDPAVALVSRAKAAEALAESQYDLARAALEKASPKFQRRVHGSNYSRRYRLDRDVYVPHWLWSQSDRLPQDVMDAVTRVYSYAPIQSRFLDKGFSIYHEPMDGGQ